MKIVFVTNGSFGTKDATGDMLNNVFAGMPNTCILQYSLRPISQSDVSPIQIVSFLPDVQYSVLTLLTIRIKRHINRGKCTRFWKLVRSILFFIDELIPPIINRKEFAYIESFVPDVIYTLGADIKVLKITRILAKRYNKPIVIHNMDDYYNMDYQSPQIIRRIYNRLLRKQYRLAYKHSHMSLAIGPKMADEYHKTFNLPFDWVMNCVPDTASFPNYHPKDKINLIIFSGGLHGGRAETLAQIAKAIEGKDLKLEIFTSSKDKKNYYDLFSSFANTQLLEYVKKEDMFINLSRADVLLHVESYYPRYTTYFRLSMSTKIPEYMSVCRPIMCVGPLGIATVDFIKERKVGLVVNDISQFEESISLLSSVAFRVELVSNSMKVVSKDFFRSKMQMKIVNAVKQNLL